MLLLETERLLIKVPTLADIKHWYSLHSDPEVMQFIDGARSKRTIQKWLEQDIAYQNKHGFCMGSVFHKDTNQFIGRAGAVYLNYEDNQPDIEIGFVLHKAYWGQGYGTELVKALIKWGFNNLPVTKLVAVTHPENKKSQRVLEKAGMHFAKRMHYHSSDCDLYEILKEAKK